MLAPQYTLRRLLAIVTMAGFACLVLAAATRGRHLWAVATLVAMMGLGLTVLLQAVLFGITRVLGLSIERRKKLRANVDDKAQGWPSLGFNEPSQNAR